MNHRLFLFLLLVLFLLVSFATLPRNPLLNDDAALYALSAKNAVVHHQWLAQFVTPGDSQSFLDKPPLGIWLLALPLLPLGVNELTIHLPNLIYYFLLLILLYLTLPKRIALITTLIAATSLALVVYSRTPKLDLLLTLTSFLALLSLFRYLTKRRTINLYYFTLATAAACLIKSGFGLIIPGTTILGLWLFIPAARQQLTKTLFSRHFVFCTALFIGLVGSLLWLQRPALGSEWLNYIRSFTIQSKYNISYLGFGWHWPIIGLLLITIFPWSPLFLVDIFKVGKQLTLRNFCLVWFWANLIFLFFFYNQTDFRTFTFFVPPLAILAALKLAALKKAKFGLLAWNLFFLVIFLAAFILLLNKPVNPDGFYLGDALWPIGLFIIAIFLLEYLYLRPAKMILSLALVFIILAYSVLFYNTLPLATSFNPDVTWPGLIKQQRLAGKTFCIYRPRDRQLFFSPDLFYVDFLTGPAEHYFWQADSLCSFLKDHPAIILSDTASWNKLQLTRGRIIAKDNYSQLVVYD